MASFDPLGGQLLYAGQPLRHLRDVQASGGGEERFEKFLSGAVTKTYWEPEAVAMPLYGTDWTKGVLGGAVNRPDPRVCMTLTPWV